MTAASTTQEHTTHTDPYQPADATNPDVAAPVDAASNAGAVAGRDGLSAPKVREREGLPEDSIVLIPAASETVPVSHQNRWGLLIIAAATARVGGHQPVLLAGSWLSEPPSASLCDGDVVVQLHARRGEACDSGTAGVAGVSR